MLCKLLATSVTVFLVFPLATTHGQKMYWTDPEAGVIQRANLDGSNVETVVPKFRPTGTAVDIEAGKIYWTDSGSNPRIQRANLDGSNVEDLITGLVAPYGIAFDQSRGKLYWTDAVAGKVQRANLDGSFVENVIVSGLVSPRGIAIDEVAGHIYWTDFGTDRIQRANLDGGSIQNLIVGGTRGKEPQAIALDLGAGKMYWVARRCTTFCLGSPMIHRANLDGSNPETVIDDISSASFNAAQAIALDFIGQKIYWTHRYRDTIKRMNLNGTDIETLVRNEPGLLQGIALDLVGGRMYWADGGAGRLRTATLDGADVETKVETGIRTDPYSLAIDTHDRMLYWGGAPPTFPNRILRTPLARLDIEDVTPPGDHLSGGAFDLAVDPSGGKMYWVTAGCVCDVCYGDALVHRANLDGSDQQTIHQSESFPVGVALDLVRQKLYWADRGGAGIGCQGPAKIYRSELNGFSVRETVDTDLFRLRDVAVDVVGLKIYWILGIYEFGTVPVIQRSNLDGSEIEDVISEGLGTPLGLAIDAIARKLYWTDTGGLPSSAGRIMRANLNGTEIEELVVTGGLLTGPSRIALDVEQPRFGACCDESTGTCTDDVLMQACEGARQTWTEDARCELLNPPCVCVTLCENRECGNDGCGGECGSCAEGQLCDEDGQCVVPPIPTVSVWGLIVLALLLLTTSKLAWKRRPRDVPEFQR